MSKDILPRNKESKWHGYCEIYYSDGRLCWRGVWVNGLRCGYIERYDMNGSLNKNHTGCFVNGEKLSDDNPRGYCYIWNKKEYLIGTIMYGNIIVVE